MPGGSLPPLPHRNTNWCKRGPRPRCSHDLAERARGRSAGSRSVSQDHLDILLAPARRCSAWTASALASVGWSNAGSLAARRTRKPRPH